MNQKPTQGSSRAHLGRLTAAFATSVGGVLISVAPVRADHHHYGHDHHGHGSDFGFFFGLPVPIPVVVYEPRVYSAPTPAYHHPAPRRPYYDEGHWRHQDGWDRRDERGEWPRYRYDD